MGKGRRNRRIVARLRELGLTGSRLKSAARAIRRRERLPLDPNAPSSRERGRRHAAASRTLNYKTASGRWWKR